MHVIASYLMKQFYQTLLDLKLSLLLMVNIKPLFNFAINNYNNDVEM